MGFAAGPTNPKVILPIREVYYSNTQLYRSKNAGLSWSKRKPHCREQEIRTQQIFYALHKFILLTIDGILNESNNNGSTWTKKNHPNITTWCINTFNNKLYKFDSMQGELYVSDETAVTWQLLNIPPAHAGFSLAVSYIKLFADRNNIIVGTSNGAVIISHDNGRHFDVKHAFSRATKGEASSLIIINNRYFATVGGKFYMSKDSGHHWKNIQIKQLDNVFSTRIYKTGDRLVLSTTTGIYMSDDSGGT